MKNQYMVRLINQQGCEFDSGEFTNLEKAQKWASGRGQTEENGKWYDYTVHITKFGEEFKEYKTR